MNPKVSALLIDPSLFTVPYDAALTRGLAACGVRVSWVGRPFRTGEDRGLQVEPVYYPGIADTAKGQGLGLKLRKGASHLLSGLRLLRMARLGGFDVIHFQWAVLPICDVFVIRRLARDQPVIITVHDLSPFNGAPTSRLQSFGFDRVLRAASRIIVHTRPARDALVARGHDPQHIVTVPHGPLSLSVAPVEPQKKSSSGVWRILLFGKLQPYKGVDVLLEALGRLRGEDRARLRVVIAGEPLMAMEPLVARARELGLEATVEFRLKRLSEEEMAVLFAEADTFVFPYRQIEASGVLHLVLPYQRWIVASDLGAFADLVIPGRNGVRVPANDAAALSSALLDCIGRTPDPDDPVAVVGWDEIGRRTLDVYKDALLERTLTAGAAA